MPPALVGYSALSDNSTSGGDSVDYVLPGLRWDDLLGPDNPYSGSESKS